MSEPLDRFTVLTKGRGIPSTPTRRAPKKPPVEEAPDATMLPTSRFDLLTRVRNLPPAEAPRVEIEEPKELTADAPPTSRFEALTKIRRTSESSKVTPTEQPAPIPNAEVATWEVVIDAWKNPRPGSTVDLLVTGMRGYAEPDPELRYAVKADMIARDKVGRERYGTPLQPHNGRDAVRDAYEEALDLRVYVENARLEGRFETDLAGQQLAEQVDGVLITLRRLLG